MTQLSEEAFSKLSQLCKIQCTEEEKGKLLTNISKILTYVSQLEEVNTQGVDPCIQAVETNTTRDDIVKEPLSREAFLSNAPSHIGGMIRVPPIIKSSS